MKSVMAHSFSQVPRADIPRSSFDRSHGLKTTFDADYLIPVLVDDILPGDTFNVDMSFHVRLLSATFNPLLDNLYLESFFFFVPYRLVWYNFPKFHGAQDDPNDSISYTIPALSGSATEDLTGSSTRVQLARYLGLPDNSSVDGTETSCLPFRAYSLIWDEWFRDQNLQNAQWKDGVFGTDYGTDSHDNFGGNTHVLLKRGKRHDYFTSGLTAPQKGDAVSMPLGTTAPVLGIGVENVAQTAGNPSVKEVSGASHTWNGYYQSGPGGTQDVFVEGTTGGADIDVRADLSSATASTINELRLAFQTQRLLERDARSGTRYNEMILAHFGVTVPDFRVQRPEFLGGGSTVINQQQVPQNTFQGTETVSNTGSDHRGAMSSVGAFSGMHGFTKSFTEHGVLIGLVNVRGDITYSQGIDRYWTKSTRYDFYYPVLSQIGEQSVLAKEIYYSAADPDAVFSYQERYAEYRYKPSRLTGLMAVDHGSTLSSFHLSEDFAAEPSLDATFIQANTGTPLDRAIAVSSQPQFVGDFYFSMKCARPMPLYGVPGNLDHF